MKKELIEKLIDVKIQERHDMQQKMINNLLLSVNQNTRTIHSIANTQYNTVNALGKLDESLGMTLKSLKLFKLDIDKEIKKITEEITLLKRELLIQDEQFTLNV